MLKNGFYNLLASVIRITVTILTVPIIIRLLGVERYGLFTLASTIVSIATLAEAGLSMSTTVFISRDLATGNYKGISQTFVIVLSAMVLVSVLISLSILLLSPIVLTYFNTVSAEHQKILIESLYFGAITVGFKLLQQVFIGVEQAYQRYDWINIVSTLQILFTYVGMWILASRENNIIDLMKWQSTCTLVGFFVHGYLGYSLVHPVLKLYEWSSTIAMNIFEFSLSTWIGSLAGTMFNQFDKIIIASIFSPNILGIYSAITSVISQINQLSATAIQPFLPALSHTINLPETSIDDLELIVRKILAANCVIAFGMGGTLLTLSAFWLPMIIPSLEIIKVLSSCQILIIIYSFYSINAVGYYLLIGSGNVRLCTTFQLLASTITLLLLFIGAKSFGFIGGVSGNAGYLLTLGMIMFGFRKLGIEWWKAVRALYPFCIWMLLVISANLIIGVQYDKLIMLFVLQTIVLLGIIFRMKEFRPLFLKFQKVSI